MVSKNRARRVRVSAVAALAALLTVAFPALASAGCPAATLSQPFSQFGDGAYYTLAPGGSFEPGGASWFSQTGLLGLSQKGAIVAEGNDGYELVPGTHSLVVGPNGSALSPWFCVSSEYPTFRFVARQLGGASTSPLNVSLRWISALGVGVDTSAGSLHGSARWAPSPVMRLGNTVPLWMPSSTLMVQLAFNAGAGASYAVDDVYLDPYRR